MSIILGAEWLPLLASLALKATLILALAGLAAALLWRASAAVRHMVWLAGVAGVLALPVFAVVLPAWELPVLPASSASAPAISPGDPATLAPISALPLPPPSADPAAPADAPSASRAAWLPRLAAELAAAGVIVGLAWLALGFWGVARLARRAEVVRDPEWLRTAHDAAEQLGLRRPVRLLRARGPVMPATGGVLWPCVVLPSNADQWPDERRRAVLAHELAHVKRYDCLTQALAQVACVLFWWHPAVWYAARRLRVERERACDDLVLGTGTRASDYAAHLLEIARSHRGAGLAAPALVSMARPSHLESRLLWVLDAARARGAPSPRATLATVLLALGLIAPLAVMRPTEAAAGQAPPRADAGPGTKDGSVAEKLAHRGTRDGEKKDVAADGVGLDADTVPEDEVAALVTLRGVGVDSRYVAEMRAAGYDGLRPRQLVALRASRVTGLYADEMNAAGWGRLTPRQLSGLASVGVTREYLAGLRGHGIHPRTPEEAAELRGLRVDADFIAEMQRAGYRGLPLEQLRALRGHGVTLAYVQELRAHGLADLSPDQVARLGAAHVDGASIAELRGAGLDGLDAHTLAELDAHGVTAEYVRELAGEGLAGLTVAQLTELRAHRITAEYVRSLRAAGVQTLTPDALVRRRAADADRTRTRERP